MKGMKKLLSVLMVLTLVLSLGATALAETLVTVPKGDDGTYRAYQIFKGNYGLLSFSVSGSLSNTDNNNEVKDKETLADVQWGDGIDPTMFIKALEPLGDQFKNLTASSNAEDVAKAIADAGEAVAPQVADAAYVARMEAKGTDLHVGTASLTDGYYLIVNIKAGEDDAYNHVLLQLLGKSVTIQTKADGPQFQKKVQDKNDSTGEISGWQDAADYDIGDTVPFQLKATTPSKGEGYKTYKMVFHDQLSAGLSIDTDDNRFVQSVTANGTRISADQYVIDTSPEDGCSFHVTIENVVDLFQGKEWTGKDIVIEYNATLSDSAVIGGNGNPNTASLEFSNNPNVKTSTGKTPEDKVVVFTYELDVNKVEPDGEDSTKPLDGAGFTLYKWDSAANDWQEGKDLTSEKTAEFKLKGLDDGRYKLVETIVPEGYNKAEDIFFKIEATESLDPEGKSVVTVTETDEQWMLVHEQSKFQVNDGVISTDVVNRVGLELPETGGIGTTIFYVAGAVLVAAAVILLVTKKRVNGAEK